MERKKPFCAWKLILICFLCFHNVSSNSVSQDDKTKDTLIHKIKVCPTVYVIGDSSYVKSCGTVVSLQKQFEENNVNLALCILVYDTTSKICEYSSKRIVTNSSIQLLPSSVQDLDKDIEKFEHDNKNISDVCKNISSIFNKLNHLKVEGSKDLIPYLELTQKKLLSDDQCYFTCHRVNSRKINDLCTYLLWVNEFFTSLNPIKAENGQKKNVPEKEIQPNPKPVGTEENHENNNRNENPQVINKNETQKKIDNASNTANESENQQNNQKLPSSTSKKSGDISKPPIDDKNLSNNEAKNKPKDQKEEIKLDESNNRGSLPAAPKDDSIDVVGSKKDKADVDNAQQKSPAEINQDVDSASAEDHQIRKENDPEKGIDQDNADNDQKESNNQGVEAPAENQDDNDEHQQKQKFVYQKTLKEDEESHFFTYFSVISLLCIVLYIAYHNKQKIFAILLEGRKSRRGRGSRRRPSTASYRKLDSNLEEAITSQCDSNVTHVIY